MTAADATEDRPMRTARSQGWVRTVVLPVFAAISFSLALAGLMLLIRTPGDTQANFVSHEPELGLPGGRIIYYPGRAEAVVKVWGLDNLPAPDVYQFWAVDDVTGPRLLAQANSSFIQEIDLFLHADLVRVKEVLVTLPPAPETTEARGKTIVTMTR